MLVKPTYIGNLELVLDAQAGSGFHYRLPLMYYPSCDGLINGNIKWLEVSLCLFGVNVLLCYSHILFSFPCNLCAIQPRCFTLFSLM